MVEEAQAYIKLAILHTFPSGGPSSRYTSFVLRCLLSDNSIVTATSWNGVFGMRMFSPLGSNAQLCCDYLGLPLSNIQGVSKKLA